MFTVSIVGKWQISITLVSSWRLKIFHMLIQPFQASHNLPAEIYSKENHSAIRWFKAQALKTSKTTKIDSCVSCSLIELFPQQQQQPPQLLVKLQFISLLDKASHLTTPKKTEQEYTCWLKFIFVSMLVDSIWKIAFPCIYVITHLKVTTFEQNKNKHLFVCALNKQYSLSYQSNLQVAACLNNIIVKCYFWFLIVLNADVVSSMLLLFLLQLMLILQFLKITSHYSKTGL